MKYTEEAKIIVEIGRRLYERRFVASNDGNISIRVDNDRMLISPTCISKGFMKEEDLVLVDFSGTVLEGSRSPSSEYRMHLQVYRSRPDIISCVHAHPVYATAFAATDRDINGLTLPETLFSVGEIGRIEYASPSSEELAELIRAGVEKWDALLLNNHGALTVGRNHMEAYDRMETLEHISEIKFIASMLGSETVLPDEEKIRLYQIRKNVYGK